MMEVQVVWLFPEMSDSYTDTSTSISEGPSVYELLSASERIVDVLFSLNIFFWLTINLIGFCVV